MKSRWLATSVSTFSQGQRLQRSWNLSVRRFFFVAALVLISLIFPVSGDAQGGRWHSPPVVSTQNLSIGGATLQIDFAAGDLDLPQSVVLGRIKKAAQAVVVYYGRFPVHSMRILVVPVADRHGVVRGTTWGDVQGFPAFTRIALGQHTTEAELNDDWTITHELVHTAFPQLPDDQHWMEEGLATYIEPIARVQAGELDAKKIWSDMLDGMPQGEPKPGDEGLDRTHSWASTYWGGALFCLAADVAIRQQTGNRKGLQDALRGILEAGNSIAKEGSLPQLLSIGDKATGTDVLTKMYATWSQTPQTVDLSKLETQLGVVSTNGTVTFNPHAPLAPIREAITTPER